MRHGRSAPRRRKIKLSNYMETSTQNDPPVASTDLFGSSYWRAEGWEDAMNSAQTGDRFRGEKKDGTWDVITLRVLEGIMEGRHPCRFVYAGWTTSDGRHCESSFECFATLSRRIESLPNV